MKRLRLLALVVLLAGCGTPPGASRAASDAQSTIQPTVAARTSAPAEASTPAESEAERVTAEGYLLSGFRTDPTVGQPIDLASCVPIREELPGNATHGVGCTIADGPAALIGAYLFPTPEDARRWYEERLSQYGVELGTFRDFSSCGNETPMHPVGPGEEHSVPRYGTFLNEDGFANLRAVFPLEAVYVGVLGRTDDCGALDTWAHFPPELGATPNPVNVWSPPPAGN